MPCGGGDIGCNVWVEDGDVLMYFSQSGTFDENNTFLKLGRVRVQLSPNPFNNGSFKQELHLEDGYILISGANDSVKAELKIWVDVFNPTIHIDIQSKQNISAKASYENWRYQDRLLRKGESFANSYKWAAPKDLQTKADHIDFHNNGVLFYHKNEDSTIFDVTVHQQGLDSVKEELYNPLQDLTFGGYFSGKNFVPASTLNGQYQNTDFKGWQLKSKKAAKQHELTITLNTKQIKDIEGWKKQLFENVKQSQSNNSAHLEKTKKWWNAFWQRSFIETGNSENDSVYQIGQNYQLFRYMLACNAYGKYPTKFNGGLFTVDPIYTNEAKPFTPDFRNWGGGTFTAQNQRLVYFPMLAAGDFDMMKPQFDFYLRILKNAELRSKVYWNHSGACYTEQIENFGLPNCSEYNWKRPADYDPGRQYNAWLEYQYDTVLEICYMILQSHYYNQTDIHEYIPLIASCLDFFDQHYQALAKQRGSKTYDGDGKLVLYPGSSCETYKMAYNATSTVAALQVVLDKFIQLPTDYLNEDDKTRWIEMRKTIPEISLTSHEGHTTIAPAKLWERVNNTELPQFYPVYPWGIYGVGKPDLDIAINTWNYDPDAIKFRSHVGWKQDNIFAARMGLTNEAAHYTYLKLKNGELRFPAFWGPGFDWTPDHNWGGSGMIGLQEMLMQTNGEQIILFPAWPKEWDVHFKLHAPQETTVEAELKNGKVRIINVFPKEREKDIINYIK